MKFKKGHLAVSLALCLLLMGTAETAAFAANTNNDALPTAPAQAQTQTEEPETEKDAEAIDNDDVNDEQIDENGSDNETENETDNEVDDAQAQADLAAQTKITEAEAISAAEKANTGCTFTVDELDSENGIITYDLKGTDTKGKKPEVKVNAIDGTIMPEADDEYKG